MGKNNQQHAELSDIYCEKVRQIRESEGMTRQEFAQAVQISVETLKGIEYGKHEPSGIFLKAVCTNPIFRKYTAYLMIEPFDETDDDPNFPLNIAQSTPKNEQIKALQAQIELLKNQTNEH